MLLTVGNYALSTQRCEGAAHLSRYDASCE